MFMCHCNILFFLKTHQGNNSLIAGKKKQKTNKPHILCTYTSLSFRKNRAKWRTDVLKGRAFKPRAVISPFSDRHPSFAVPAYGSFHFFLLLSAYDLQR